MHKIRTAPHPLRKPADRGVFRVQSQAVWPVLTVVLSLLSLDSMIIQPVTGRKSSWWLCKYPWGAGLRLRWNCNNNNKNNNNDYLHVFLAINVFLHISCILFFQMDWLFTLKTQLYLYMLCLCILHIRKKNKTTKKQKIKPNPKSNQVWMKQRQIKQVRSI